MDVVRVSNSININEQQQQQQQPQQQSSLQLQTPQQQQNFNLQNGSAKFGKPPRNGLKSSTVTPGSTGSLDGGTGGGLLHQVSASSGDSGNSSCVSGGTAGPDDPETRKNETGLSASASAECEVQVTKVSEEDHDQEEAEDERQALLLKTAATPSLKKTANIYVNKTYDEGLGGPRGSSTETEDFREEEPEVTEDVKPLLLENEKRKPPKSIVKSPSNLSFGAKELNGGQRPRLNLQFQQPVESVICDRPVHHVQFSKQQDNGYCYQPEQHQDQHGNDGTNGGGGAAAVCGSPVGSILSRASGGSSTSSGSSSSNESSAYAEARPPDGGWGWVVCFASFMVNLIADGVTFSFGVLYVELLNYFGEGKGKTAWVGSLFMAMPLLSGPIASFLTDRYGCRNVTIVGSILASLGFALSAYANTIEMLYLTFGVLAGFGLSLCYVAAVVIVAYYFDKKRSFATGLSVCGSGIGTCIFATATQILLDEYGWRGTTLILAGIFLNMCLCGLLMRDLEWTTHKSKLKRKQQQQKEADSYSVSNSTNTGGTGSNLNAGTDATVGAVGGQQQMAHQQGDPEAALLDPDDPRLFSSLISFPTFIKNGEKVPYEVLELLYKHRNVHEHVLQNYPNLLHSRSFSEPLAAAATTGGGPKSNELSPEKTAIINPEQREPLERRDHHAHHRANHANLPPGDDLEQAEHPFLRRAHSHRPTTGLRTPTTAYLKDLRMHRHSLTYRGAMLNIQRYRLRASSCPDIYRNSMTTIAKEKTAWYQGIDEFKTLLVSILDLSYFRDVHFLLFAISNFLLYTWYDVPYVYLTDNATEMGFSPSQSSMLISIIGIVNMVGEIVLGWMGDRKSVNPNTVYAVCMGLCGLVTALVPLFSDYLTLSVLAGAFGLFIAANYSLTSIILVELITLERFTNAYGLLLLVQGVANLVGPPLAGWISDMTQNYNLSFYLAGLFIALSGLLLFVLPAIGKYKKFNQRRTSKQKQQQQQQGGGGTGAGAGTGIDCYGMDHLTRLPPGSKPNGTSVLITDCFAQEKLLKEGANV